MKEYGVKESWIKLYTFKYSNGPESQVLFPPICMSSKGEILHVFEYSLAIYNPKDYLITYPKVTNVDDNLETEAELYIESLVSPILQNKSTAQTLQGAKTQVDVLYHARVQGSKLTS
uniref:Uncharacterized protein isoform X3 n=1 Tax=Nicotiana tabacum TaxID=4097 RepID=A0A1S4DNR2_TOBAC|nr:PREDICTED: uncharacterized protein LOC107831622 isoform X3 [Nicotiana tabacum]